MNIKNRFPSLWSSDKSTYDPFQSLQQQIDRLFNDFRSEAFTPTIGLLGAQNSETLIPKMDVSDTDTHIDIEMELPGVDEKDVDISIVDKTLTVMGKTESKNEKKQKNYHLVERTQGSFYRQIPLGFEVDVNQVRAKFKSGVLHVSVKKPPEITHEKKKVSIETA